MDCSAENTYSDAGGAPEENRFVADAILSDFVSDLQTARHGAENQIALKGWQQRITICRYAGSATDCAEATDQWSSG
jgi:hypothetical protein